MSGSDVLAVGGGLLLVLGSLFFLVTAIGMLRSGDAISRVNNLSPATGLGMPLIIVGAALDVAARGELSVVDAILAALAVGGALVVSSVASNVLGRAAYRSQRTLDPRTITNALGPHEGLSEPESRD
jgi:multicomponent Na+:H+ antiporter subunit G